jgi:RNA polymerase sigma-70 factor (ECF subfamily)
MMVADRRVDEERLIAHMIGYQKGSMDDFEGLYAAVRQPLLRYLWTFVRNAAAAEDLLQETFLQIHRARQTYTPPRPVRPWIYAITRHVALMHLRSGRRRKEVLADDQLPEVPVPPEMEKLADRATLHQLLSELPRQGQEVLMLHHLLGMSFQEIGQILGITAGTAKVRSHRALKSLRQQLVERGGGVS